MAARLAEFPCAALMPAGRAEAGRLVAVIDVLGPVLPLDLLVELVDLGLGLHLRHRLVELGRAAHAQAPLGVPTDLAADPLAAVVALLEVGLHLLDGLGERLVAGRAAHGAPHELSVPAELCGALAEL